MTPNDIEVLIHYHTIEGMHPRRNTPAVRETIKKFLRDEVIENKTKWEHFYTTTEKGEAWLKMILETPYPKQIWIDPRDKILKKGQPYNTKILTPNGWINNNDLKINDKVIASNGKSYPIIG